MKTTLLTLLIGLGLVLPTLSLGQGAEMDANGDGVLTIDEVQAIYPDITAETFSAMDVNADGALDEDELVAAQQAGLMPVNEG